MTYRFTLEPPPRQQTGSTTAAAATPTEAAPAPPQPEPVAAALKPRELVEYLDRYIVGQADAKRAVAIALRNRWRRHKLPDDLKGEVIPKNILMIGPTGCGKVSAGGYGCRGG